MIARLLMGGICAIHCVGALAQPAWARLEAAAYQATINEKSVQRKNDTVELLQAMITKAEPGSDEARRLTYRLAAVHYRQLRFAEAEVLIAPLRVARGGSTSVYRPVPATDSMVPLVLKGDFAAALALGNAGVPRHLEELARAAMAEELLESAYASAVPGSPEQESMALRRAEVTTRAVNANFELARLYSALAETHHAMKAFPDAEKQYRAALGLFAKDRGSDRVPLIHTRTGLAKLLRTNGDTAGAMSLQQAALADMKLVYPRDHAERVESEAELVQLRAAQRKGGAKPAKRGTAGK